MRVLETCLYVDDLDEAERFYVGILGFTVRSKQAGRHLFLFAGDTMLLLFDPKESVKPGSTPTHEGRPGGHVCFAIKAEDTEVWHEKLTQAGLSVTRYRWGDRGESLYFHDPAGNLLELAPPGIWGLPNDGDG